MRVNAPSTDPPGGGGEDDDPDSFLGRKIINTVIILCIIASLVTFPLFYAFPAGRDTIVLRWLFSLKAYGTVADSSLYAMETEWGESVYRVYTNVYISFATYLGICVYILLMSASSYMNIAIVVPKTLSYFQAIQMKFWATRKTNRVSIGIFKDENGGYYSHVYLFMFRCFTFPIIGLLTTYLTGYQNLMNLYGSIAAYFALNILFFMGGMAFDSVRHFIKVTLQTKKDIQKHTGCDDSPLAARVEALRRPEMLNTPFVVLVPMFMTLAWAILLVIILTPVVQSGRAPSGVPGDLRIVIWMMTSNILLSSLNFFLDMLCIIMFVPSPKTFQEDTSLLNKKIFIASIFLHLAEAATSIAALRILILFALKYGEDVVL
jgi:hypothetical protein